MIYSTLHDTKPSLLGMGNMRLPIDREAEGKPVDRVKAQEIIDYAMTNGINYYDTAYGYHNGDSERFLGEALAKYPRDSYYLATKYNYDSGTDYKAFFEEQLERLKTDYIDFYLIHCVSDRRIQDYFDCGCLDYFQEQKEKGRIRYFGFSSHASPKNLRRFAEHHEWDFAQLQLNYYDWLFKTAKEEYEILREKEIPIIVMEPIRGGRLVSMSPDSEAMLKKAYPNRSIAAWALHWVKSLPGVKVVLSGMSTLDQIVENVREFSDEALMDKKDEELLFKACEAFRTEVCVPCTECRYCDVCPEKIDIANVLKFYNLSKTDGERKAKGIWQFNIAKPETCVQCGLCNERCPQNIDIKKVMSEVIEIGHKFNQIK